MYHDRSLRDYFEILSNYKCKVIGNTFRSYKNESNHNVYLFDMLAYSIDGNCEIEHIDNLLSNKLDKDTHMIIHNYLFDVINIKFNRPLPNKCLFSNGRVDNSDSDSDSDFFNNSNNNTRSKSKIYCCSNGLDEMICTIIDFLVLEQGFRQLIKHSYCIMDSYDYNFKDPTSFDYVHEIFFIRKDNQDNVYELFLLIINPQKDIPIYGTVSFFINNNDNLNNTDNIKLFISKIIEQHRDTDLQISNINDLFSNNYIQRYKEGYDNLNIYNT